MENLLIMLFTVEASIPYLNATICPSLVCYLLNNILLFLVSPIL